MILELLAGAVGIIVLAFAGLYFRSQSKDAEEPDTVPILINHMKGHSNGHSILKVIDKKESENRVKFVCFPRDLNGKELLKLSKGKKKFHPYTLYFDKKFVDAKPDFSDYVPVFEGYPDKIEDLSESDKKDPRVIQRVNEGNKASDMFSLMKARQEDLARIGMNLAGGKLYSESQNQMVKLFKDKLDMSAIKNDKEEK